MEDFLAFVRKIGTTVNGDNIYEFMFTTAPDVVWGENFNIIPAGIVPNIQPEINTLSRKGRVITDIDFKLACQSTCFSMMDCIDKVIALCFTEAGIENEFHFDFAEPFNDVVNKLKKYNLELVDLKEIKKIDENVIIDIIDDTLNKLNNDSNNEMF